MTITLTYGGMSLNDGTTFTLLEGFDPGEQVKTFAEYRGYAGGTVAQYNISSANLIEMRVPIKVTADSMLNLRGAIDAINDLIDDGEQDLVYGEDGAYLTYHCVESPRVPFRPTSMALNKHVAVIDMVLYRTPDVEESGTAGAVWTPELRREWFPIVVTDYGAMGNGTTDDTDAIQAAIDACATDGGTVYVPPGTYLISDPIAVPTGVNIVGMGKDAADPPQGSVFLCSTADSSIVFGTRTGGTTGGLSGNFGIDGAGLATVGLYVGFCVERTFQAINVYDCVDGILVEAAQNNSFIDVNVNKASGKGLTLDYGCGGNLFTRCNLNDFADYALHIKQSGTSPSGAYDYPQHNEWHHGIFERPQAGATAILRHEAGGENCLLNCILADNGNLSTNALINLNPDLTHDSARFQMIGGRLFGWADHDPSGVDVGVASALFAHVQFIHLDNAFVGLVGNSSIEVDDIYLNNVDNWSDNLAYAAATIKKRIGSPLELSAKQSTDMAILSLVDGDTGYRFEIDGAGIMYWGGGSAAVDTVVYRSTANCLYTPGQIKAAKGITVIVTDGVPDAGDEIPDVGPGLVAFDDANDRLYVYTTAGWKYATLT